MVHYDCTLISISSQTLPNLGPYAKKKEEVKAEQCKDLDLLGDKFKPEPHTPHNKPKKPVPNVKVGAL